MPSVVVEWTRVEIVALRRARRMTVREFAKHLGLSFKTVANWEAGVRAPLPHNQAILDTSLATARGDAIARFWTIINTNLRESP